MFLPLYQKKNRTPANIIKIGSEILKSYNIEEPVKNAEILLSEVLGKKIPEIYLIKKEIPSQLVKKYINFLKKRIERIPLQYIVGKVGFYKYNFFVEEGVFIPRPETEILVGKAIEIYKRFFHLLPVDILDIGTGCGNIGISLALEIEKAKVIATDISEKALEVAKKNACKYNVKNKVRFIKNDLFPEGNFKFDIIVSNPPYI
ncbi:peptide chain release factor N(5)-glutamine methyltransferase, partial [bacterium]|nr:peptide chain release factor N(5)-glutamine methyltransferase [bacterium]